MLHPRAPATQQHTEPMNLDWMHSNTHAHIQTHANTCRNNTHVPFQHYRFTTHMPQPHARATPTGIHWPPVALHRGADTYIHMPHPHARATSTHQQRSGRLTVKQTDKQILTPLLYAGNSPSYDYGISIFYQTEQCGTAVLRISSVRKL